MILMRYSLQIKHSLRFCFQPPLTVPWTEDDIGCDPFNLGSRAPTVGPPHGAGLHAQQVPHRTDVAVTGRPKNVPRRLGQGSNAAAAHVAKVADRSPSGQTVDSCGAEIVGRFLFLELPYKLPHKHIVIFLINKKYTNLRSYHHQPSCLPPNRLMRPQHPLASFLSSVEINRKSSPRPLFISSTALRAWHPVEPMSTTSPGPVANQPTQVPPRVLQL